MNSKDFISGLLLGTGIGVVAGILLAPEKGSDTLKKISEVVKDKFNQVKGDAEHLANAAKNKGGNLIEAANNSAKDLLYDGKEKVDKIKDKANTFTS